MKMRLIKDLLKDPKTLIKIKVGVALAGLAAILVILLVVAAALLAPIRAGVEVFEGVSDATSAIAQKLGNFFTLRGWKLDKEAEEQDEREFYEELEQTKKEYRGAYGVEIDTDLILATIFYGESIKDYLDVYETCDNPSGSILNLIRPNRDVVCSDDDPQSLTDWKTAKKQIRILARHQIADNYYQYDEYNCDSNDQGVYLVGRDIDIGDEEYDSRFAWQVAKHDDVISFLGITLAAWDKNTRYYKIFVDKEINDEGILACPDLDRALEILDLEDEHVYTLEVAEGHERTEPTGVYYWNLLDEPNTPGEKGPSFLEAWYEDYLKSAPAGVTEEERKKELIFNIYEFARAGLADHDAYRNYYSGIGEESFGDIDFVSRTDSIEGLNDAFYTSLSNPFYRAAVNAAIPYSPYQCTTYVYGRVTEILAENGTPGTLNVAGDASMWYQNNLNMGTSGYASSSDVSQPRKGAIAVFRGGREGWGHVAFVENVNSDGTIDISEGNIPGTNNKYGYLYTAGIDPNSSKFQNLYGLQFVGYIYPFD